MTGRIVLTDGQRVALALHPRFDFDLYPEVLVSVYRRCRGEADASILQMAEHLRWSCTRCADRYQEERHRPFDLGAEKFQEVLQLVATTRRMRGVIPHARFYIPGANDADNLDDLIARLAYTLDGYGCWAEILNQDTRDQVVARMKGEGNV